MRTATTAVYQAPARFADDKTSVVWTNFLLTVLCACALAAGFFLAARQHFNAIDLSMKNSKLRRQIEDLETEKRRLLLAREMALSPAVTRRNTLAAAGSGHDAANTASVTRTQPQNSAAEKIAQRKASVTPGLTLASASVRAARLDGPEKTVKKIVLQTRRPDIENAKLIASAR